MRHLTEIRRAIGYRLTGEAMVDRYVITKQRVALSAQEVIAVLALLSLSLGLLLPWGGITSAAFNEQIGQLGGAALWGSAALAIAGPQAVTMSLVYMGFTGTALGHTTRIALLSLTTAVFVANGLIWLLAGSYWTGAVWPMIFAVSAAAAARHVHLYNGHIHAEELAHLDPDLSTLIMRYRPGA